MSFVFSRQVNKRYLQIIFCDIQNNNVVLFLKVGLSLWHNAKATPLREPQGRGAIDPILIPWGDLVQTNIEHLTTINTCENLENTFLNEQ